MEIAEFLLARIAEDEAAAEAAIFRTRDGDESHWTVGGDNVLGARLGTPIAVGPWGSDVGPPAAHIARHDPTHVLAECEAKRRVADRYQKIQGRRQDGDLDERLTLGWVLEQMAAPYANHPEFQPEWKP